MIGEFWPNPGMNEYDPYELLNERKSVKLNG